MATRRHVPFSSTMKAAMDAIRSKRNSALATFLATNSDFDPSQHANRLLMLAVECGNDAATRTLLGDARVNPVIPGDSEAFRLAAKKGYTNIIKLLLKDGRCNPGAQKNNAIRMASNGGHSGTVRVLLSSPCVDPTAENNFALSKALVNGHVLCVGSLLACPSVIKTCNREDVIKKSIATNNREMMNVVLWHLKENNESLNVERDINRPWRPSRSIESTLSKNIVTDESENIEIFVPHQDPIVHLHEEVVNPPNPVDNSKRLPDIDLVKDVTALIIKHLPSIKGMNYVEKDGNTILTITM